MLLRLLSSSFIIVLQCLLETSHGYVGLLASPHRGTSRHTTLRPPFVKQAFATKLAASSGRRDSTLSLPTTTVSSHTNRKRRSRSGSSSATSSLSSSESSSSASSTATATLSRSSGSGGVSNSTTIDSLSFQEYLLRDLQQQYCHYHLSLPTSLPTSDDETAIITASSASKVRFNPTHGAAAARDKNSNSAIFAVETDAAATAKEEKDDAAIARARWLLLIAAALYGTNFSCVKLLGEAHLPVGASSTVRFGLAALATAPWLFPHSPKEWKWGSTSIAAVLAGLEVGAWNSVGYVAQAVGLETTAASKSAFLCSLAVVVVPLLDYLFKGKVLQNKQIVGTLLALGGVGILELGGLHELTLTNGDLASLIQPLAFGMGFWRMEAAMHKYPQQALRSTAAQLMAVFLGSAIYCFGIESAEAPTLSLSIVQEWLTQPVILLGLIWTGIVTTALTVYMETMALETLSAAETTLIFSTEPLWGTAFAAAVMGEQLGIDSGIGALCIVAGCLVSNLGLKGIQELISPQKSTASAGSKNSSVSSFFTKTTTAGGLAASLAASTNSLWNNISVAAKVTSFQLEDFLQDIGLLVDNSN